MKINSVKIKEGMILSNEPGYYKTNEYGIRIENLVYVKEINKIVSIELSKLKERVGGIGYELSVSAKAKSFICEKGFDEKNGARPLNRMIQKYIEDLIAENLVSDKIKQGDKLLVDHKAEDDHLTLLINKKEIAS